jgi:purine-binding chemotaxis protein CheW
MAAKKTEHETQGSAKRIAASIRKPVLPAANKLEQALQFAQKSTSPAKPIEESVASSAPLPEAGAVDPSSNPGISAWSLMPKSSEERQVLQARAKIFAKREQQQDVEVREQYIRFRLGESAMYGISYASMEEILPVAKVSRVPCTPDTIAGIVNYRGELLTVLDLKQVFSIKNDDRPAKSWILVIKEGGLKAGLVVDEVDDNDEFALAQLSPPLDGNELVRGIHQGKVVILSAASIFAHPALNIDESVD